MKTGSPVEVRRSPWATWPWLACAILCAATAVWAFVSAKNPSSGLGIIMLLFAAACVLTFLVFRAERLVLHADRVERIGLRGGRSLRRDAILGFKRVESEVLLFDTSKTRRLAIPLYAFKNPMWRAWIESCRNVEVEEINDALKAADADPDLGHNVADRRRALDQRHRIGRILAWAMIALALWTAIWPRPFGIPLYLCCAAPLVAIMLAALRPDIFRLFPTGPVSTRVDLLLMIMAPMAMMLMATRLSLIDWLEPLLIAAITAAGLMALAMKVGVEASQRSWIVGALLWGFLLADVWAGAVILNRLLDRLPPVIVPATVVRASDSDKPEMDVVISGPKPIRMSGVRVPQRVFEAYRTGSPICAGIFPGRFGWRTVHLAGCDRGVRIIPTEPRR